MAIDRHMREPGPSDGERIVFDRAGRRTSIRLPRHGVLSVCAAVALLTAWGAAAGGYVLFHDTVVAELRRGAQASAKGYEVQIAMLRDELERSRTRRLVERTGVDERLAELARRQEALERRQGLLAEIADPAAIGAATTDSTLAYAPKPTPLDRPTPAFDDLDLSRESDALRSPAGGPPEKLSSALDRLERDQARALERLAARTGERRRKLERVYDAAGVGRPAATDGKGRGGPFEPLPERAVTFEARADQILAERALVAALDRGLDAVPIRTPAPGVGLTSGFGARVDPFLGRPAFHAGVDFDSEFGDPVRATAAGRVTTAGSSGGYGNMVEIDHGGGLTTRFGHMSSIAVGPGQQVRAGAVLGRVGSTGRSTGPHLHYETRIDGEAVNPIRFLNAGRSLATAD